MPAQTLEITTSHQKKYIEWFCLMNIIENETVGLIYFEKKWSKER